MRGEGEGGGDNGGKGGAVICNYVVEGRRGTRLGGRRFCGGILGFLLVILFIRAGLVLGELVN